MKNKNTKALLAGLALVIAALLVVSRCCNYKRAEKALTPPHNPIRQEAVKQEPAETKLPTPDLPAATSKGDAVVTAILEKGLSPKGDDKVVVASEKLSANLWEVTLRNKGPAVSNAVFSVTAKVTPFTGEPVAVIGPEFISGLKKTDKNTYHVALKNLPPDKVIVIDFIAGEASDIKK